MEASRGWKDLNFTQNFTKPPAFNNQGRSAPGNPENSRNVSSVGDWGDDDWVEESVSVGQNEPSAAAGYDHSMNDEREAGSRSQYHRSGSDRWNNHSESSDQFRNDCRESNDQAWSDRRGSGGQSWNNRRGSSGQSYNDHRGSGGQSWSDRRRTGGQSWNDRRGSEGQSRNDRRGSGGQSWNDRRGSGGQSWNDRRGSGGQSWNDRRGSGGQSWNDRRGSGGQSRNDRRESGDQSWNDRHRSDDQSGNGRHGSDDQSWNERHRSDDQSWSDHHGSRGHSQRQYNRDASEPAPIHTVSHYANNESQAELKQQDTLSFRELFQQAEEHRLRKLAQMAPIIKDVFVQHPRMSAMLPQEVESFREMRNGIKVHYVDQKELSSLTSSSQNSSVSQIPIPNPVRHFEEGFYYYPEILHEIAKQGFTEPSPIQSQMWPCLMKGMDVVGIAQTGSGKTLAFLLPAMIHIEKQNTPREARKSPTVLVLAPTRELAQQIDREVKKYSYKNIRSVCLYGGGSRNEQIEAVSIQTEIIIATPGRLNDLVQAEKLDLSEVSFLVLDEADEMLDAGFEPQINKALLRVRGDRQTVMTSATWPASVRRMAKNYTQNPVMVVVGTIDIRAVNSVKQNIVFLEKDEERFDWIVNFIKLMNPDDKIIVFVGKKAMADHIASDLSLMDISVQTIHGALCQSDREQAIADMQTGETRILIATDVAARGIDIENVTHIINHGFPGSVEQYVHRIGRTGRAGKVGEAYTFIGRRDWSSAQNLIEIMENAEQEVPEELRAMAERFKNRRPDDGRRGFRGGRGHFRGGSSRW